MADLTGAELGTIPYLVLGRVIARALISSYRAALLPSNAIYVLRNTASGWGQLRWFSDQPDGRLTALLSNHVGRPGQPQRDRDEPEMEPAMTATSTSPRGKMVNAFRRLPAGSRLYVSPEPDQAESDQNDQI